MRSTALKFGEDVAFFNRRRVSKFSVVDKAHHRSESLERLARPLIVEIPCNSRILGASRAV